MLEKYIHYYKPYKIILFGVMLGSCIAALLDLLFPVLVRQMLNEEIPQQNISGMFYWAGLLLALYVVNFCLLFAINYYGHIMSMRIENDMRMDLFAHLEDMSFRFFDNNRTGQLLSSITSDIVEISELTFRGPNDILVCSISMLGSIGMMLYMNPFLGGLISLLLLIKTVHTVFVNRRMKAAFRRSRVKSGELSAQVEEVLSGIRLVKAFANEKLEMERFAAKSSELMAVRGSSFGILAYFSGMVNFFTNFTNLAVLVCGGIMITAGELVFSDFVAFFLYVNFFMKPILRLMVFTEMYQRGMAGFERFNEIMNKPSEISDDADVIDSGNIAGRITFENVCFGYSPEKPILQNFSLEIAPGETVAFVGTTGAGKTTLASLLLRFYELDAGRILLDGVDIRKYSKRFLRQNIGLLQQDVFLFYDSVRFNIAYGKKDATDEEVREAAGLAAADDFINALPEGYNTKVGERGVKLSGGQKQRISIARNFLKNPLVMIFDEATSALDIRTERQVQASLNKLAVHRTTLVITHRLSTIINADKIIVLQQGRIVEIGKHQELIARNGVYKKLYDLVEE